MTHEEAKAHLDDLVQGHPSENDLVLVQWAIFRLLLEMSPRSQSESLEAHREAASTPESPPGPQRKPGGSSAQATGRTGS